MPIVLAWIVPAEPIVPAGGTAADGNACRHSHRAD
jgi:hypothetical protein